MRTIKGDTVGKDGLYPEVAGRKGDVIYPNFYINIKHLPEAKDWKIGKTYDVTLRLRQTGLNLHRHEGRNEDSGSAEFEIIGIDPTGEVKPEPKRYPRRKRG